MILECPSCHNRYLVDPRAIGKAGRTVRCAKCRHEWFAEAEALLPDDVLSVEQAAEKRVEPRPIPKGSSVPAIHTPRNAVPFGLKFATAALFVLFLLSALAYFRPLVVQSAPFMKPVYAAVGMYDSSGIVFADLEYSQSKDVSKDRHNIGGYLVNTSTEAKPLPVISITLTGKEGEMLRRVRMGEDAAIAPGEKKHFTRELDASPESAQRIVVETGSPFELKLR